MGLQKVITLVGLMSRAKLEIERFRKPKSAVKIPETKSKTVAQIRKAECQGPKLGTLILRNQVCFVWNSILHCLRFVKFNFAFL